MSKDNRRSIFYLIAGIGLFFFCCVVPLGGYGGYLVVENTKRNPITPTFPPFTIVEITATPQSVAPQCSGPEVMYILMVGSDTRSNSYTTGLADAIRILRIDFVNPGVTMLSFQRDLYVEIPGISDHHGITHGKLNQAYLYGTDTFRYYDEPDQGLGLLTATLEHNFGANIDYAAAVNLQTFVNIIDAIGGLNINLPYAVDGRSGNSRSSDLYFPAGEQHLNGYRTMILARLRPEGDLVRNRTQDIILQALAVQILNPATLQNLPQLIDIFKNSVQTTLTQNEIVQLLCLAPMIDPQTIRTVSFPEELLKLKRVNDPILGNTSILDADPAILREYVQQFNNGTWDENTPQP
jgi:polyisoprenyl-teichoic acid--peptidoglycan teichoic acid transferase